MLLQLLIFFILIFSNPASAKNIFGLHLTQTSDIEKAIPIINSSKGDWGWVTIVVRSDQLNQQEWQDFFNKCRRGHIIPIIRLATIQQNSIWQKPDQGQIDKFADFFSNLTWPTTNKHITLFNEVNRSNEWGGEVDPKSYADIVIYAFNKFKSKNTDFVVLSAGLDASAPNIPDQFISLRDFYRQVFLYKPEFFDHIDGITSHAYPNPGFSASPYDESPTGIKSYLHELNYLKSLGIEKNYPVYITETGWTHNRLTPESAGRFLLEAFKIWQKDDNIIAVTPFIFNYPYYPFEQFSWLDKNEKLLSGYQQMVEMTKSPNIISQITNFELIQISLPLIIFPDKIYQSSITLKNTGESIWGETQFCLSPKPSTNITLSPLCSTSHITEPGQSDTFYFSFSLNKTPTGSSFLEWENISKIEISPIAKKITIYHQKITLKQFLNDIWKKIAPPFLRKSPY